MPRSAGLREVAAVDVVAVVVAAVVAQIVAASMVAGSGLVVPSAFDLAAAVFAAALVGRAEAAGQVATVSAQALVETEQKQSPDGTA